MGIYLNPGNANFQQALNSEIYVDKSNLMQHTNRIICTEQKYICISRPRRFGKSMAANMLAAYYSRNCDSKEMFEPLNISKAETFEKYLNKYNVIHVNMIDFVAHSNTVEGMISYFNKRILHELKREFPDVDCFDWEDLISVLLDVFAETKVPFIFIIDEWDYLFRIHKNDKESQTVYLNFLRNLLKDKSYVALAYMTGILPIKKYGEHSALNVFTEISMTDADPIAEFTGFTENEVKDLCTKYNKSFMETKSWYDGYTLSGYSIYNPKSVVESIVRGKFNNYWTSTETYEALKVYIEMNYDGLKDTIIELLAGNRKKIDTTTFSNDMVTFHTQDDVLTLLVHLGYLAYDFDSKTVAIPNHEIAEQFASTIKILGWSEVATSLKLSDDLLDATMAHDEDKIAQILEQVHQDNTSILKYHDENSLSCVISLAYYSARKYYITHREMPAGKGFADLVFIPRKNVSTPAFIVELKVDASADTALEQIKRKEYTDSLKDYSGEILLVGINYDKTTKKHSCNIEVVIK